MAQLKEAEAKAAEKKSSSRADAKVTSPRTIKPGGSKEAEAVPARKPGAVDATSTTSPRKAQPDKAGGTKVDMPADVPRSVGDMSGAGAIVSGLSPRKTEVAEPAAAAPSNVVPLSLSSPRGVAAAPATTASSATPVSPPSARRTDSSPVAPAPASLTSPRGVDAHAKVAPAPASLTSPRGVDAPAKVAAPLTTATSAVPASPPVTTATGAVTASPPSARRVDSPADAEKVAAERKLSDLKALREKLKLQRDSGVTSSTAVDTPSGENVNVFGAATVKFRSLRERAKAAIAFFDRVRVVCFSHLRSNCRLCLSPFVLVAFSLSVVLVRVGGVYSAALVRSLFVDCSGRQGARWRLPSW
jgi:hypothetical protein